MNPKPLAKFDPYQPSLPSDSSLKESSIASATGGISNHYYLNRDAIPPYARSLHAANPRPVNETGIRSTVDAVEKPSPVIFPRRVPLVQDQFVPLQKWEGSVLEVLKDSFIACLVDFTNEEPDEEAEFSFEEVPDADRSLVEPGAIFYWNIGYIDNISGQRIRVSIIRFRRLPVWRPEELEAAKLNAQRTRDLLNWK